MTAKLDVMGHRWLASLANYNFISTIDLDGVMGEADALSRINWGTNDPTLPAESIQAIVTAALTGQGRIISRPFLAVTKLLSPLYCLSMTVHR